MQTVRILRPEIAPGRRVLVTSDVHGHLAHLNAVLEQAAYTPEDYLIFVGDIIEKGPQSLATLRRIMQLAENPRVIVMRGNVDLWRVQAMTGEPEPEGFFRYLADLRSWKGTSIFDEMCAEFGIRVNAAAEVPAALTAVRERFAAELDFLASRPDIVDTPAYTFVHGGLPSEDIDALADKSAHSVLKFDAFADRAPAFRKWIVTGHWPTANYHDRTPCHNPVFFRKKRILAIDGGCGIRQDGQLNLMIFPAIDCAPEDITFVSHDDYPTVRALDAQAESADSINIRWIDHDIRVLAKDEDFADIEHVRTGHRLRVPTPLLLSDTAVRDCTDYRLPVEPGDTLRVILETAEGILAKKNAVTGWYYGAFTYR